MPSLNKVMLIGNLTREPLAKATPSGYQICELGLAVNRRFRTQQNEEREETCFVDMEAFGKTAELCSRFLHKGSLIYAEGRLRMDQWQDKATGQNRSRLKVSVDTIQFLDRKDSTAAGDYGDAGAYGSAPQGQYGPAPQYGQPAAGGYAPRPAAPPQAANRSYGQPAPAPAPSVPPMPAFVPQPPPSAASAPASQDNPPSAGGDSLPSEPIDDMPF
jgi:single-strand DNA-binding protein